MQILPLEQNSEAWRFFRKGKLGGTTANSIHPPSRGTYKDDVTGTATFWRILGEKLGISKDGESEMERGHRLEPFGVQKTAEKYGLKVATEADKGVWQSDEHEDIYLSPDGAEEGEKPTFAIEVKAFDQGKHLMTIYRDWMARKEDDYSPLASIPKDNQGQVAKYFLINPDLKKLYWTLIDDRTAYKHLEHYVIEIERKDVEELVEKLKANESSALTEMNRISQILIEEMANE